MKGGLRASAALKGQVEPSQRCTSGHSAVLSAFSVFTIPHGKTFKTEEHGVRFARARGVGDTRMPRG